MHYQTAEPTTYPTIATRDIKTTDVVFMSGSPTHYSAIIHTHGGATFTTTVPAPAPRVILHCGAAYVLDLGVTGKDGVLHYEIFT